MERIIILVIITASYYTSAKHVYVSNQLSWSLARQHCNDHYVDLSCLTSPKEEELFRKYVNEDHNKGWIGLYWDNKLNMWKWSDGENVTYSGNRNDLSNGHSSDNIQWNKDGWSWQNGYNKDNFFCFTLSVVQEEKTWEEALEYCRNNSFDLTSLLSETDVLMATNEINKTGSGELVWIGLRYLGDSWMWVNDDPLDFESWSQGDQDRQCPTERRCGALTKEGVWESWDCQEKLPFICSSGGTGSGM